MRKALRENALGLVLFFLFFVTFIVGQSFTGQREYNAEQEEHGQPTVTYVEYVRTGHFVEATFENWESEFLQMWTYVLLTVWLKQKGSSESKPIDGQHPSEEDPDVHRLDPFAPWPVRRGGVALAIYENSLSIAFFVLFVASWLLHAAGGVAQFNEEQQVHGGEPISMLEYLRTARFWFESLQNWQSEFLAVAAIVVFTVYLRQRGSPESKPVHAPHAETGA